MLRYSYIINHVSMSPHKNHERLILYVFILQVGKRRLGEVKQVARGPNSDLCDSLASPHDTMCQARREMGDITMKRLVLQQLSEESSPASPHGDLVSSVLSTQL